ncbi:uncharacterized protein B0H18DRAFT_1210230 [Fomitopsis serialis]|uniref:uncharacterized protein n=1 Tax=Fomitopsis serialis TaxID=139415 RepID=UPI0020075B1F|nr:uncharacterized protein B0H18DRAFT_1210230 [Neoantrodia serialis]KAH9928730.1 hypothetical protein B0H18DRAFT_1210230 [Neoantrodia serialis]
MPKRKEPQHHFEGDDSDDDPPRAKRQQHERSGSPAVVRTPRSRQPSKKKSDQMEEQLAKQADELARMKKQKDKYQKKLAAALRKTGVGSRSRVADSARDDSGSDVEPESETGQTENEDEDSNEIVISSSFQKKASFDFATPTPAISKSQRRRMLDSSPEPETPTRTHTPNVTVTELDSSMSRSLVRGNDNPARTATTSMPITSHRPSEPLSSSHGVNAPRGARTITPSPRPGSSPLPVHQTPTTDTQRASRATQEAATQPSEPRKDLLEPPFQGDSIPQGRPKASDYIDEVKTLLLAAVRFLECRLYTINPYPNDEQLARWAIESWADACDESELEHRYKLTTRMLTFLKGRKSNARLDVLIQARQWITRLHGFSSDTDRNARRQNAERAAALLHEAAFHYKAVDTETGERSGFAQHKIVSRMVEQCFFKARIPSQSLGVKHSRYFNPISAASLAFIFTALEAAIEEWRSGTHEECNFREEPNAPRFRAHLDDVEEWVNASPEQTQNIRVVSVSFLSLFSFRRCPTLALQSLPFKSLNSFRGCLVLVPWSPSSFRGFLCSFRELLRSFCSRLCSFRELLPVYSFRELLYSFRELLYSFRRLPYSFRKLLYSFRESLSGSCIFRAVLASKS